MTLQIIPDSLVAEIDQPARDAIQKIVRVEFGRGVLLSELVARFDKVPPAAPQLTLEKHVTSVIAHPADFGMANFRLA
jgi:hypothetical protein